MVLEVALLNVRPGQRKALEQAFADALAIISSMGGYERPGQVEARGIAVVS